MASYNATMVAFGLATRLSILRPLPARLTRPLLRSRDRGLARPDGRARPPGLPPAPPVALAADLARYGSSAQWKGVYYRGEKIGFMVGQTVARDDGFELREDGRLQMTLLGATTAAQLHERRPRGQGLRPPLLLVLARSRHRPHRGLGHARRTTPPALTVRTASGDAHRNPRAARGSGALPEPPAPARGPRPRRGAAPRGGRLRPRHAAQRTDDPRGPGPRGRAGGGPARAGLPRGGRASPGSSTTSWITDVGEVVREESPMGLVVVRETRGPGHGAGRARTGPDRPAGGRGHRAQPRPAASTIPRPCERLRVRLEGVGPRRPRPPGRGPDGRGRRHRGPRRAQRCAPGPPIPDGRPLPRGPSPSSRATPPRSWRRRARRRGRRRAPAAAGRAPRPPRERAPREEADREPALGPRGAADPGRRLQRAHRPLRGHGPRRSACPARIAVGLVYLRGAFYYHAWPEVYVDGRPPAAGSGCPSTRPSTSSRPTPPTSAWPAAASTGRRRSCGLIGRPRSTILDVQERAGLDAGPRGRAATRPPPPRPRPPATRRRADRAAGRRQADEARP